ncbi:Transposase [Oopsacas minuta]|uniref:Transposase n=1 Tax=Oopsacas minuta TaxID=111878 RepID=A0AAV7JZ51_9METZ|nr:Transposase [Oopsacas minuta]
MASKDDNFNLKWRAYIEFRTILKIQPVQIFSELQEILCVGYPSRSTVERDGLPVLDLWVPHKLSENQRLVRLNKAKKLLETHENCDSRHLTEIITGDETWVYCSTPYSKYKKRSWVRGDEQPTKFPTPDFRKPKIIYTIFFSSHGIVLQLSCESDKAGTATFFTE